jgi:pimeloyl-ACP methyl ester carboxylesterase
MVAASLAPELFDTLVMLDPVMHPPAGYAQADPRREGGAELADRARRRRQVFESREAARTSWSEKELFADWQPRAFELYLEEGLADRPDGQVELKCRSEVEAAIFQAGRGFDPWPYLDRVLTPALWMRAERGNFPRFVYDQAAQRMADARVIDLPLGHLMLMEDPEGVLRELTAFVDAGAAQRSTG